MSNLETNQREYAFNCTLSVTLRVQAASREEAESLIREHMDAADCNGGMWPNNDPILFEASVNDSPLMLYEVDGEHVEDTAFDHTSVGKLIRRIFAAVDPGDVDNVINRVMHVHPEGGAAGEPFAYQMRGVGCINSNAILNPEFADESKYTVRAVQKLMSAALSADGITEWPDGTTQIAVAATNLTVIDGRLVATSTPAQNAFD